MLGVIQAGAGDFEVLISQTSTTKRGTFSGSAAFLAEDEASYNDYGFVRLRNGADVIQLFFSDIDTVGAYGFTEWTGFPTLLAAGAPRPPSVLVLRFASFRVVRWSELQIQKAH